MFDLTPSNRNNGLGKISRDWFDMGRMFDDFFNDSFLPSFYNANSGMKVDVKENEKEYVVEAELPGIKKEEVNIELRDDRLTIAVERNEQTNEERDNYIRKERRYGSMARSFYVERVKNEEVKAKFDNGVLTITLPKQEGKQPKSNRIDIQ